MTRANSEPSISQPRVLVVDDELGMREFLQLSLRHRGYKVTLADDGQQAIDLLGGQDVFDIVISDLTMPNKGGLDVLATCQSLDHSPISIMMTAFATTDTAVEAMKLGAEDYLVKPFKLDELYLVFERALARRQVLHENERLKDALDKVQRLDELIARSPAMIKLFDIVKKVAPTPTNVLIHGESGTGKELIAKALHNLSDRKEAPWIPVNCAAIPASLLESELFGHVKGAFTGATSDRAGLFESAGRGTIFLDEIGEMELAMQAKLLRVLQERKVRPVGGRAQRELHCRVVAATHRDLSQMVQEGSFREDLYFRLNVIQLQVPPLRERREDIGLLVQKFFEKSNLKMGGHLQAISPAAMRWFLEYAYPGNVRELENLMERAVALESGSSLGLDHLPAVTNSISTNPTVQAPVQGELEQTLQRIENGESVDLDQELARFETAILKAVMLRSEGHRKNAATILGISERSLRYRLQKLTERPKAA